MEPLALAMSSVATWLGKCGQAMQPTAGTPRDPNNFGKQWRNPGQGCRGPWFQAVQ
jgi:hypothetical protein